MATDLSESLDSLRFLVAIPGTFSATYPDTDDDMLVQVLMDGLAECHLEGMLKGYESDADGLVTPDLTSGQLAAVVLFAGVRFMRAALLNLKTAVTYKAGSAEYHTEQSANVLRDILADLKAQKSRLILVVAGGDGADSGNVAFWMADQYLARVVADWSIETIPVMW